MKVIVIGLFVLGCFTVLSQELDKKTRFIDLDPGTVFVFKGDIRSNTVLYNNGEERAENIFDSFRDVCRFYGDHIYEGDILEVISSNTTDIKLAGYTPFGEEVEVEVRCNNAQLSSLLYNTGVKMNLLNSSTFDYDAYSNLALNEKLSLDRKLSEQGNLNKIRGKKRVLTLTKGAKRSMRSLLGKYSSEYPLLK